MDKPLEEEEKSEQLKRYRRYLGNLILTDYLEFRWYVDGELRRTGRMARVGRRGKISGEKEGEEKERREEEKEEERKRSHAGHGGGRRSRHLTGKLTRPKTCGEINFW